MSSVRRSRSNTDVGKTKVEWEKNKQPITSGSTETNKALLRRNSSVKGAPSVSSNPFDDNSNPFDEPSNPFDTPSSVPSHSSASSLPITTPDSKTSNRTLIRSTSKTSNNASKRKSSKRLSLNFGQKKPLSKMSPEKRYYQFEIWIRTALDLPQVLNGRMLYCNWRRGSNKNSGSTKHSLVNERLISWEEKFTFTSKLNRKADGTYESSGLTFKIKDGRDNKIVGKCTVDLSQCVASNEHFTNYFVELGNKGKLKYRVNVSLLRINNLEIVGIQQLNEVNPDDPNIYIDTDQAYITRPSSKDEDNSSSWSDSGEEVNFESSNDGSGSRDGSHSTSLKLQQALTKSNPGKKKVERTLSHKGSTTAHSSGALTERSAPTSSLFTATAPRQSSLVANTSTSSQAIPAMANDNQKELERNNKMLKEELELYKKKIQQLQGQNKILKQRIELIEKDREFSGGGGGDLNSQDKIQDLTLQLEDSRERESIMKEQTEFLRKNNQLLEEQVNDWKSKCESLRDEVKKAKTLMSVQNSSKLITNTSKKSGNPFDSDDTNDVRTESNDHQSTQYSLNRLVYHADCLMEPISESDTVQIPSVSRGIFDWFSAENVFSTPRPKIYSSLFTSIKAVAVKKVYVNSFDTCVYWLSTVTALRHFLEDRRVRSGAPPHFSQILSEVDQLIHTLHNNCTKLFMESVSPHIVEVFCVDTNPTPKKVKKSSTGTLVRTWDVDDLCAHFGEVLISMRRFSLPLSMIRHLFTSFASNLNHFLFNLVCSKEELCTAGNGFQIKLMISRLEEFANAPNHKLFMQGSLKKMKEISEAATILSLDKGVLVQDDSMIGLICPSLNIHQIRHIVVSFRPDKVFSEPVSLEVIDQLGRLSKRAPPQNILLSEPKVDINNPLDLNFTKTSLKDQLNY
eukprot:TRINITY_DN9740_c0_g1_i1.p1 TRINITY_DN9740_c0_g1~~TRINITY_DN9740_c0_g1_i1.p1  ORF type:complete len:908 (+),score=193.86 TRINITY_DN9740_c0_g1_i1:17-2740(+)